MSLVLVILVWRIIKMPNQETTIMLYVRRHHLWWRHLMRIWFLIVNSCWKLCLILLNKLRLMKMVTIMISQKLVWFKRHKVFTMLIFSNLTCFQNQPYQTNKISFPKKLMFSIIRTVQRFIRGLIRLFSARRLKMLVVFRQIPLRRISS